MKTTYNLVDNFLPTEIFSEIKSILFPSETVKNLTDKLPWYYNPAGNVIHQDSFNSTTNWRLFYLTHMIYDYTIWSSSLYETIRSHCYEQLDIKALIRIKINMYPNTQEIYEHGMHTDYPFSHKAGILSINTCDGYTKLEDGTKIDSNANRMLLFDASTSHTSSTCTDQPVRVNINFNYF